MYLRKGFIPQELTTEAKGLKDLGTTVPKGPFPENRGHALLWGSLRKKQALALKGFSPKIEWYHFSVLTASL